MPITTFNNIKYLNMNLAKKTRFRVMCNKDLTFSSKEIVFHQISLIINKLIRILGLKTK